MKIYLSIIAVFCLSAFIYSQDDSCYNFTPGWIKGENKNIKMQVSQNFTYGDSSYNIIMRSDIDFMVSDIVKDTFYVEWNMKNFTLTGLPAEAAKYFDLNSLNDLTYKAKLDQHCNLISLLNIDELLDKYFVIIREASKNWAGVDSTRLKILENNKELYKSKLIADASNVISTLFYAYNIEFPLNGIREKTDYNVIGQDTIQSKLVINLIQNKGSEYTYNIDTEIDSTALGKLIAYYKNSNNSTRAIEEYASAKTAVNYIVTINRSTGWVMHVKKSATVGFNNDKIYQTTEYFIN